MSDETDSKASLNSVGMRLLKAKLLLLAVLIIFPWLAAAACAKDTQPARPPLNLPFALQQAGNKVETEFQVKDHRIYIFILRFGFNKSDKADRARVRKLVGGHMIDKYGKLIEPGIPIVLRIGVNVIGATGGRQFFEKEFSDLKLTSSGDDFFSKEIVSLALLPGHYQISVESLMDVPELHGTNIFFVIGSDPKARDLP